MSVNIQNYNIVIYKVDFSHKLYLSKDRENQIDDFLCFFLYLQAEQKKIKEDF